MRYENLLTRSFAILRRKPWLWFLALLAGETRGGGGGGSGGSLQTRSAVPGATPDFGWVPQWFADRLTLFIEIGIAIVVIWLAWFLLSCLASGALVGAAARVDAGEPMSFGAAWRTGVAAFRRVLAVKLLMAIAILLPMLLLVAVLLLGALGGFRGLLIGVVIDLPLLAAVVIWSSFLDWFAVLALRACILGELGARASIAAAWDLLKRRFPRIAMTTVVFTGVGVGIGILTSIVFGLLQAPFTASIAGDVFAGRWTALSGTLLLAAGILVPVSIAVSSAVGAYFAIAWTLAFRRFGVEGQVAEPPRLAA